MQRPLDTRLEAALTMKDIEILQKAFLIEVDYCENFLTVNREEFGDLLMKELNKGTKEECEDLFDRIDVTKEGWVDWEKFASYMLLEFYEKDDRIKSSQVPQWKNLKLLSSPHKDVVQKIYCNGTKYFTLSKESIVGVWDQDLKLMWSSKTVTDSCKIRDLWATSFAVMHTINKIAISYTSKEIMIYDMSKGEFAPQYKIQELQHTALYLTFWANPENANEAILAWSDTGGNVHALLFQSANIALFERPPAPPGEKKQETLLSIHLRNIVDGKYRNARYVHHSQHPDWARQVMYSPSLECFISCSTSTNAALVIGWLEKAQQIAEGMRTTTYCISQGVNAFDYHEQLNLIVTAGVNNNVCLWNPYVVSKPSGLLRGHMASVIQVQFNKPRGQLISFSKDKVLRIWDIQLQVCIQRLAGIFPKGPESLSVLYFDDHFNRLFISFSYQITFLEMKAEVRDYARSHDSPVIASLFSRAYSQVVTICQQGTMAMWLVDTGQKLKQFSNTHSGAEVTCMVLDETETRLLTGGTDGLIKMWDFNGHCYHVLHCNRENHPCDVGFILSLKSAILAAGWTKYVTIFRLNTFRDTHVQADDWKGGQAHTDDILCLAASFGIMASASYSGEIIIWNLSSEQCTRQLSQRVYKKISTSKRGVKNGVTASQAATRENTMMSTASGTAEPTEDAASAAGSQQPRARSGIARLRPQSSNLSAAVLTLNGEDDPLGGGGAEGGAAVTRLIFLDARRTTVSHSGGVNLVSCGGNGWVRFWNTTECTLLGEFVAHERAGSIIMAVLLSPDGAGSGNSDGGRRWLATGDVDGFVRTWDISAHCTQAVTEIVKTSPPVIAQFQAHRDMVTSMEMFERNRCVLLLTSSCDCSVSLWDISGRPIGTFGQEMHWKIEPYVAPATTHEDEAVVSESHSRRGVTPDDWKPDDLAIVDPKSYRFNTWQESILGKNYQELRTQKRERKQPGNIEEQPIAGPFAALNISNLSHIENPQKPENLRSLDRMMDEKQTGDDVVEGKMPTFADTLNAVFDEKNFFPKYILDYEAKMKSQHARILLNEQKKAGESLKAALFQGQGAGEGAGGSTKTFNSKAGGAPYRHSNVKIH